MAQYNDLYQNKHLKNILKSFLYHIFFKTIKFKMFENKRFMLVIKGITFIKF